MRELRRRIRVGVIGGSSSDNRSLLAAYKVGQLIAQSGAILICGGLGGVMEAAASGAKSVEGTTIGIIPGNNPAEANPHIDVPIATGLGYSRNSLVAMNADALIAIAGEYGTLSEIAFGNIYGKKVVGLGTWEVKGVVRAASPEEAVELALRSFGSMNR
jgi:uncharacterized protein (TIGR00725 family)